MGFQTNGTKKRSAVREHLFRGAFYPHFACEAVGRSLYFTIYEYCKRTILSFRENKQDSNQIVTLTERMASAALAGISTWAFVFPLDSLRNRMYNQTIQTQTTQKQTQKLLSMKQMCAIMYRERSIYRGFWVTVIRAGPVAATVSPVYDLILERLTSSTDL